MKHIEFKNRTGQMIFLLLLSIIIGVASIITVVLSREDKTLYRESQVIRGNLARGVTENGSVDVGTVIQNFDLDISEFTGSGSFTFGMERQGGDMVMDMMPGVSDSGSTSDRQLEIEQVYVEAGQEIETGTPILKLTQESVEGC